MEKHVESSSEIVMIFHVVVLHYNPWMHCLFKLFGGSHKNCTVTDFTLVCLLAKDTSHWQWCLWHITLTIRCLPLSVRPANYYYSNDVCRYFCGLCKHHLQDTFTLLWHDISSWYMNTNCTRVIPNKCI